MTLRLDKVENIVVTGDTATADVTTAGRVLRRIGDPVVAPAPAGVS